MTARKTAKNIFRFPYIILPFLMILVSALAVTGCGPVMDARVGISTPPGLLYSNTISPAGMKRARGPGPPFLRNGDIRIGTATAHRISFEIPTITWTEPLSFGWGDMSTQKALENGNLQEMYWMDAQNI